MKTDVVAYVMLVLMAVALIAAVVAVLWAVVVAARKRGSGLAKTENRVPARRIAVLTLAGTLVLLLLTFVLGSSVPVPINGKPFDSIFWLRAADMFICSSGVLLVVAVLAYLYAELKTKLNAEK